MFASRPLPSLPTEPLPHAPTHATGGPDALTASDIGAASAERTVSAGFGMSGGGDLSNNRTFAVDPSVIATVAALRGAAPKGVVYSAETAADKTLSGAQTVGGLMMGPDKVVLLTAQSTPAQNGVWVTKSGAWVRPTNSATGLSIPGGSAVYVEDHGGVHDKAVFFLQGGDTSFIVGTDAQVWTQVAAFAPPAELSLCPYGASTGAMSALGRAVLDPAQYAVPGRTLWIELYVVGDVSAGGLTGTAVLFDLTDNATVSTLTWTETDPTVKTDSVAVPTGEHVYEVRAELTTGSGYFTLSGASLRLFWS